MTRGFFAVDLAPFDNRLEVRMYVALEHTTHPVCSAAFFGLERDAYAAQVDELASRRAAWLDGRPASELASYGVPVELADPGSLRFWTLSA